MRRCRLLERKKEGEGERGGGAFQCLKTTIKADQTTLFKIIENFKK